MKNSFLISIYLKKIKLFVLLKDAKYEEKGRYLVAFMFSFSLLF
jgi:hypothetical protein